MAAGQCPGGGLWAAPQLQLPLESLLAGSLFPDEAAAALGFFGGSLPQRPSSPPPLLCAAARFGNWEPQDNYEMFHEQDGPQLTAEVAHSVLEEPSVDICQPEPCFNQSAQKVELQNKQEGVLHPKVRLALPSHIDSIRTGSTGVLQGLQGSSIILDRPDDDGYNWRKYGQKAVKGGKYPRSYYKCTLNCPVRKNVEHSADGRIIKVIYRGQHNHERPSKRFGDYDGLSNGLYDFCVSEDASTRSISHRQGYYEQAITSNGTITDCSIGMRAERDDQYPGSSDKQEEGDDELRTVDGAVGDTNGNERNVPGQKIIVSTTSDVDLLDDGYRWRKYGQKVVRGNPHPRSYYKCSHRGCNVKKHIERSSEEPDAVITTYEGKHIHDVPVSRNKGNAAASNPVLHNTMSNGQPWNPAQAGTEQPPASFCGGPEKRKYGTVILNHFAFLA